MTTNKMFQWPWEPGQFFYDLDHHDHEKFDESFVRLRTLGAGGDGIVSSYVHPESSTVFAVKVSINGKHETCKEIMDEIQKLEMLGRHDHFVDMLASFEFHTSLGTAILFELCDLGDLHKYRESVCEQERTLGRPARVPEVTIWKLLKDMSLALDFIHNGHEYRYVHNDLKPDNILVSYPDGWDTADGVPAEPVFKICDFARLTQFPTPRGAKDTGWRGTPEYAPPLAEQKGPIKPSADMWSLGATIQGFATGIFPIQSREAFVRRRKMQGKDWPQNDREWDFFHWRKLRPAMYRPINVTAKHLMRYWDVPDLLPDYKPYSFTLHTHYAALFDRGSRPRITSADLVKYVVPIIDERIADLKKAPAWKVARSTP